MDRTDLKLLALLQENAALTIQELAERVRLSVTPCWRRIRKLEAAGVIQRRVTLLDPAKLGVGVTVFARIKTRQHSIEWYRRFAKAVAAIPEIVEFYRMSGDVDYLLKILVPDIAGYDAVYKRLISAIDLEDVSSSFALERIKSTTAVPLSYAAPAG
ncbi:MAG: Lrp/AsnC family transcriptional regulator [Alphaproteobacteria bacterium]